MIKILLILLLISTPSFASGWYSTLQGTASDVEQDIPSDGVILQWSSFYQKWLFAYGVAPSGGTTGQVLTKNSGSNYDYSWTTPSGGGSSQWTLSGSNIYNSNNGNVNIGTTMDDGSGSSLQVTNPAASSLGTPTNGLQINFPNSGDFINFQDYTVNLDNLEQLVLPAMDGLYVNGSPPNESLVLFQGGLFLAGGSRSGDYAAPSPKLVFISSPVGGVYTQVNEFDFGDGYFGGDATSGNLFYQADLSGCQGPTFALPFASSGNSVIIGNCSQGVFPATGDGVSSLQVLGLTTTDTLAVTNTTPGANPGTSACIGSDNTVCKCGSCN